MATSKPLIYAELLSNIQQISVIAALDWPVDYNTKVTLSDDGRQFILSQHTKSHILSLPGQVKPNARLQKPVSGSKEFSWRLPLAGQAARENQDDVQNCDAPWPARVLKADEEFACRKCGVLLLAKGCIKTWKDLPSDNWAEMMDFWHCHKPDIQDKHIVEEAGHRLPSSTYDPLAERGYGANSTFDAQPGVGFVDITTFLVSELDCTNIVFTDSTELHSKNKTDAHLLAASVAIESTLQGVSASPSILTVPSPDVLTAARPSPPSSMNHNQARRIIKTLLYCDSCASPVGIVERSGWHLNKWCLARTADMPPLPHSPRPSSKLYGTRLLPSSFASYFPAVALALVREQLSSRILLTPLRPLSSLSSSSLLIWILGPGTRCSSYTAATASGGQATVNVPVLKLFWKAISGDALGSLRDNVGIEELEQTVAAIAELENTLRESAGLLPPTSRKFNEWNVGLLEKYVG